MENTKVKALLVGATGLVGEQCLSLLLNDPYFDNIEIWVRKPLGIFHAKLKQTVVDFNALDTLENTDAQIVFCCLGTTRKKAGSPEAFRKVDFEYVVNLARFAEKSGCQKFLLVSSIGANARSRNFYLRVKGETEQAVRACSMPAILIMRPSMLLGKRHEFRVGELMGKVFMYALWPLFFGPLKKYRGIQAFKVAKAMIYLAKENVLGQLVYESDKIPQLASIPSRAYR